MTVATATDRVHIEAVLKHNHMDQFFKKILTCSEVGIGKEHPDIYIQAAKCMQTNIAETWVFEDAYHGARTAFDAGFKVCGIYDAASAEHINELKNIVRCMLTIQRNYIIFSSFKETGMIQN